MLLEHRYARALRGDYAGAGVPPPVSGPSVYRRIARSVLDAHGLDPLGDPIELARAEGIHVAFGWTPGRHGMHYEDTIVVSPLADPLEQSLAVTHERAHFHLRVKGAPQHSEADAIWMTCELAFPSWLRADSRRIPAVPRWLARLLASPCR